MMILAIDIIESFFFVFGDFLWLENTIDYNIPGASDEFSLSRI